MSITESKKRTPAVTADQWHEEGVELFGENELDWQFVCPIYKHVQCAEDYRAAGLPSTMVGYSCVGRGIEGSRDAFGGEGVGPCNYAGGGLIGMNPRAVILPDERETQMFDFAPRQDGGS